MLDGITIQKLDLHAVEFTVVEKGCLISNTNGPLELNQQ